MPRASSPRERRPVSAAAPSPPPAPGSASAPAPETAAAPVCIIGAGPAGLAVARALAERGIPYRHLERHSGVGGLWDIDAPGTPMYESAHFISSRTVSGFSGYPMPDDYPDYPDHRQILTYLRGFADAYGLTERIEFGAEVASVERAGTLWEVSLADGTVSRHRAVVVCTGSQWHPYSPEIPGDFTGEVRHSVEYRSPQEFAGKRVLVVGGGNSGCDIACDAARTADTAAISLRRGYWFIPKHVFGLPSDIVGGKGSFLPKPLERAILQPILRLLNGDPTRLGLQRPDHKLFETHPVVNSMLLHHLQHGDIHARPGIRTTSGSTVEFTDGSREEFDLILLATGYQHRVPVAQRYFGDEQHPDLYLNCCSREHPGLYGVGFIETNSGAYQLFDRQAHLIAGYLDDQASRPAAARAFAERIRTDRPELSGGLRFDASPRHRGYVDSDAYVKHIERLAKRQGWPLSGRPPAAAATPARARAGVPA
ncbi:flavin-containing monooxygenase [Leucobacter massiliensis]|uniref:F420H(2):quinone oxidoreductase n=1 Tax=Leucobacter massiliensis TaxID=1686285 RepID=A0A2S9QSZ2_9MICO|nr:NAD(P)-binding domain-containing protein [Leucobacter massiliensis]PRI12682.1 F420H(2):quinone oxidoreductase [Leucobacter massiliensis]